MDSLPLAYIEQDKKLCLSAGLFACREKVYIVRVVCREIRRKEPPENIWEKVLDKIFRIRYDIYKLVEANIFYAGELANANCMELTALNWKTGAKI